MTKKIHPNILKALYKHTRMAPGADPKVVSHGHAQTVLENSRYSVSYAPNATQNTPKKSKKKPLKPSVGPRRDSDDAVVDYNE